MHFMTSRIRVLFGGAVLLALALTLLGTHATQAQQPGKFVGALIVPLGTTKELQMTTKKPIKQPKIDKPGPLTLAFKVGDPTTLYLTGVSVDQVRLQLTDADGLTNREIDDLIGAADKTRITVIEFGRGADIGGSNLRRLATATGGTFRYVDVIKFPR